MPEVHCHRCGGFIGDPVGTTFREASTVTPPAVPHSGMCVCRAPVVYGPALTALEIGGQYGLRAASRN
jgi:hypothetical protein